MRKMRCPAAPMCSLSLLTPDSAPFGYPIHSRNGDRELGMCPASGARILPSGDVHAGDAAHIRREGAKWIRAQAEAIRKGQSELDAEAAALLRGLLQESESPMVEQAEKDFGDQLRRLAKEARERGGVGIGRPPALPPETYFPGRPADAPEPGVGERPAGRPAMDLGGGFLGKAAMENARDQLQTLVSMSIQQMGQAQDTLARMTAMVDSVVALAHVVEENLRASSGLLSAAIGTGSDVPAPAQQAREQLAAALSSVTVSGDGLTMALRVKIEQAFSQVASGIEAAEQYRALP